MRTLGESIADMIAADYQMNVVEHIKMDAINMPNKSRTWCLEIADLDGECRAANGQRKDAINNVNEAFWGAFQ